MSMFYSPSTKGFYTPGQRFTPDDAVEITAKQHAKLLEKQSAGEEIVFKGGKVTTQAREVTWEQIRTGRDKKLRRSDWTQFPDAQAAMTPERVEEWRVYRQALRDLPASAAKTDKVIWPKEPDK